MKASTARLLAASCIVAACLSSIACVGRTATDPRTPADVDTNLSRWTYIEDGKLAALAVSGRAATFRKGEAYMPLEICVANRSVSKLSITLESFTLIDDQGNRYPAAVPRELIEDYAFLDQDRLRFSELVALLATRFSAMKGVAGGLSPTKSGGPVRTSVIVPKSGVMFDYVYFPVPDTGEKNRRFELFMDTPELEDPLFVKFLVP